MQLKNRKIYGIDTTSLDGEHTSLYVNFGEGRYAYVSIVKFLKNISTWKSCMRVGKKDIWVHILQFSDYFSGSYNFKGIVGNLIDSCAQGSWTIEDQVVLFKNGCFLLETLEYFDIASGKIKYKVIKSYKNHQIKFNLNGAYGFSIWKENRQLEDRIWSIAKCKEIIDG